MKHKTGQVDFDKLDEYDLQELKDIARGVFQSWIKKRDEGKPCISCGKEFKKGDVIHASHYYPANQYPGLLFDERNVHASCDWCNTVLNGNIDGYTTGLLKRIGTAGAFDLTCLAENYYIRIYKWDKTELIEIITKYQK